MKLTLDRIGRQVGTAAHGYPARSRARSDEAQSVT
jgi:hypothetical protein